ncbi:hypothetical protein BACCIP111895_01261 [Neobacillus rhizosphaerae]|uniref:HAAS transmembrane region domain-containing protein n=1 Tax=Neobacillus rhizosphaerae TaxID=2880965 RepID=A0ABM9EPP3_9BACI|nr:hypothetical protein [Neobacillus rhizosphaerae]CAH2714107.1 hypothetical protein BACCIP111895_01261 [Neobacillus rhizosphaerae]
MKLSVKSQDFLENLRLYLFSSGKQTDEIEEVMEELRDHLHEAELAGKSVDHIIGQSPKHYMKHLSEEMRTDYKGWTKLVPIFIMGVFAYILLGDAINGKIQYSLQELLGFPIICLVMLGVYSITFKFMATSKLAKLQEYSVYAGISLLSISLFISLLLLDTPFDAPLFRLETIIGRMIVGAIAVIIFIGLAIWSRNWISVIIPAILFLPEVITSFLTIKGETEIILSSMLMLVGFLIFFLIQSKKMKKSEYR